MRGSPLPGETRQLLLTYGMSIIIDHRRTYMYVYHRCQVRLGKSQLLLTYGMSIIIDHRRHLKLVQTNNNKANVNYY